jgi:tetratricopeptide (TPR) repeat protein
LGQTYWEETMTRNFLLINIIFFLTCGLVFSEDDKIFIRGQNDPISAYIEKETEIDISFRDMKSNSKRKVTFINIRKVVYSDANAAYKIAIDAFTAKNYKYAARKFSDALKSQKSSRGNWHSYYIPWYYYNTQYQLYLRSERKSEVAVKLVSGFEKFSKKFPKTRFTGAAQVIVGDLYLQLKKFPEAKKVYIELSKRSQVKNVVAKAKYGLVNLYKEEGDFDKAIDLGKQVVKAKQVSTELLQLMSEMMIVKKQYEQANTLAKSVLKTDKIPSSLKGAALELKGISSIYMQDYEQALEDLLLSKLIYPNSKIKGGTLEMYLAINIKILMDKFKSDFPSWEYQNKYDSYYRVINDKQRKFVKNFKL